MRLEHALKTLDTDLSWSCYTTPPSRRPSPASRRQIFPFLGCSRLAETIDRFDTIRAVLHGHAHHGAYEGRTRRGIPVFNVAAKSRSRPASPMP